jgi:hypothetical protein
MMIDAIWDTANGCFRDFFGLHSLHGSFFCPRLFLWIIANHEALFIHDHTTQHQLLHNIERIEPNPAKLKDLELGLAIVSIEVPQDSAPETLISVRGPICRILICFMEHNCRDGWPACKCRIKRNVSIKKMLLYVRDSVLGFFDTSTFDKGIHGTTIMMGASVAMKGRSTDGDFVTRDGWINGAKEGGEGIRCGRFMGKVSDEKEGGGRDVIG